jgi:hypothetical protein
LADFDAALAAAKTDIDAIGIATLQALLNKALAASSDARAEIGKLAPAAAGARIAPELAKAKALRTRVAELRADAPETLRNQQNWAVKPVGVLTALINAQPVQAKTTMEPQLAKLRKHLAAVARPRRRAGSPLRPQRLHRRDAKKFHRAAR